MNANHFEILSAFFDGEAVDADLLAATLREPGAAESLVDFARLRCAIHADTSGPSESLSESIREVVGRADAHRVSRRRLVGLSVAASLVLAAAFGGFGVRALLDRQRAERPLKQAQSSPLQRARPTSSRQKAPAAVPDVRTRPAADRSKATVAPPTLRIRFTEWRDTVL